MVQRHPPAATQRALLPARRAGFPLRSVRLRKHVDALLSGRATLNEFVALLATCSAALDLSPPLARRVRTLVRQAERGELDPDLMYSTLARLQQAEGTPE